MDLNLKFLTFFVVVPRRGHLESPPFNTYSKSHERETFHSFKWHQAWNNQRRFGVRRLWHCKRLVAFPPWSNPKICNLLLMRLRVSLKKRKLEHRCGKKKKKMKLTESEWQAKRQNASRPCRMRGAKCCGRRNPVHRRFFFKNSTGWWWCLQEENVVVGFGDLVNCRGVEGATWLLKLISWARRFQFNLVQLRAFCLL